ncbi:MAG: hypothetical protein EXR69_07455 [Myxococcales bacterium]|nr:hypothetical protein [Myxococcales bacterium]
MKHPALSNLLLAVLPLLALAGCDTPACLDGTDECVMPTPCPQVSYTCDGGYTEARTLTDDAPAPGGMSALGATGDILLGNDKVVLVIDALDHPHYIAPTGGTIIDFGIVGKDNDSLRNIFTATGLLPEEAAHYTSLRILDDGATDGVKAVQAIGWLDGYPDIPIATRYEVRPCEAGVRVRTEIANGTSDAISMYLTDAFYWGDRANLAFTPRPGGGFNHPSFGLSTISEAFYDVPYMVAGVHSEPGTTYGVVSCDDDSLSGFQSVYVSAMGPPPRPFPSKDWQIYERFLIATDGPSVSAAADVALELRDMLWGEPFVTVTGRVEAPGGHIGETMRASVTLSEVNADGDIPWTHVIPEADGSFSARVPASIVTLSIDAEAFGQVVLTERVELNGADTDLGTLSLPAVGEVSINVTLDGSEDHALVFVIPADDATLDAVSATTFGAWEPCAPLLGLPHGGSPGCNRVLVDGATTIALPDGNYDFYTAAGLFTTLGAVQNVHVDATTGQSVLIEVSTLAIQPESTLSADFHVHGSVSFDSEIPDLDRVRAFLASGIEVIATTEHDAVHDYSEAMETLGANDRMMLITGTESTAHVLWSFRDDFGFPQVIGHWIFWPVPLDPVGPYRGAAYDEKMEPGLLFTREKEAGWDDDLGVSQLNHPFGGTQFGRDYSWASAAGFDLTEPLKTEYDGTGQSLYFHTPEGAAFSNADYDVEEVMNGSKNENYVQYRALWFYLLNQGIVRAGTANSDSHSLTENVLGTPRNIVFTSVTLADWDLAAFDADVRAGHMIGTSGPVILASIGTHKPGVEAFSVATTDVLTVVVDAAPWVPVDQVRIVVNGEVVQTITDLPVPGDPFGTEDTRRLDTTISLADLLPASGDAWIVVEAGAALATNADLDCNGTPDTGDNNQDGKIDWRDVVDLTEDPEVDCLPAVGPLAEPPEPERGEADWLFRTVTPNGYPLAFTNPLLIDSDGNGFSGVIQ